MDEVKKHPGFDPPRPLNWREGIYHVSTTPPIGGGPWPMYRWRPSIDSVCEPLLGSSMFERDLGDRTRMKIVGVRYPNIEQQQWLYAEAVELFIVFGVRQDLFSIALYRRQVDETNIELDQLFFDLVVATNPPLTRNEWADLAQRMPKDSWILGESLSRVNREQSTLVA